MRRVGCTRSRWLQWTKCARSAVAVWRVVSACVVVDEWWWWCDALPLQVLHVFGCSSREDLLRWTAAFERFVLGARVVVWDVVHGGLCRFRIVELMNVIVILYACTSK